MESVTITPDDYELLNTYDEPRMESIRRFAPNVINAFNAMTADFATIERIHPDQCSIKDRIELIKKYPNFTFYAITEEAGSWVYIKKIFCRDNFSYNVIMLDAFAQIIAEPKGPLHSSIFCSETYRNKSCGNNSYNERAIANLIPYDEKLLDKFTAAAELFGQ